MVGFRRATPSAQQQQQQTTSLADVTPVWWLFDSNVWLIGRFSLFIIKTALDRNRRVVFTNTFLFLFLFTGTLPTYSKQKTTSIISLIKQLVATRRTTSQRLWCYSLTLTHTILRTLTSTFTLNLIQNQNQLKIVKQNQIKMTRNMVWFWCSFSSVVRIWVLWAQGRGFDPRKEQYIFLNVLARIG